MLRRNLVEQIGQLRRGHIRAGNIELVIGVRRSCRGRSSSRTTESSGLALLGDVAQLGFNRCLGRARRRSAFDLGVRLSGFEHLVEILGPSAESAARTPARRPARRWSDRTSRRAARAATTGRNSRGCTRMNADILLFSIRVHSRSFAAYLISHPTFAAAATRPTAASTAAGTPPACPTGRASREP